MTLTKVILEFDNDEIKCLSGEQAQDWLEQINNVLVLHQVRTGAILKDFEWQTNKEIKPDVG